MWNEYALNFSITGLGTEQDFRTGQDYVSVSWAVTAYNVFGHETTVNPSTEFLLTGYPRAGSNGVRNVEAITDVSQITDEILIDWVQNEWEAEYLNHPFVDDLLNELYKQYRAMNSFTFEYDETVTIASTAHLILDNKTPEGIRDVSADICIDAIGRLVVQDLYDESRKLTVTNPSGIQAITTITRHPDGTIDESTLRPTMKI